MSEFIFNWEIENFIFGANDWEYLNSPVFEATNLYGTSWFLKIFTKDIDTRNNCISCFLCRTAAGIKEICIGYMLEFIDAGGSAIQSAKIAEHTFQKASTWGWLEYLHIKELECYNEGVITVRCSLVLQEPAVGTTLQCKARTKLGIDRCSFRWNIQSIKSSSWSSSKVFSCSTTLHIHVTLTAPEDSVNIKMKQVQNKANKAHFVMCKISLLDEKGIKQDSRQSEHLFNSNNENQEWKFPSFLQKSKLQDEKNKYLKNETFTLLFEFSFSNNNILQYIEDYNNTELAIAHTEIDTVAILQEDLKRMFIEQIGADVSLSTGNKIFRAHRSILSSRSSVFAAMFETDMLENQTGVVNIPDIEADILSSFLNFVYTGTLDDLDYESALKLLTVADKYQVFSLRDKCSSFLMSNLTVLNVCDVAVVADMVGDETLKAYATDFIITHADAILISEDWSRCTRNNIKLAEEIFKKLPLNMVTNK